jgi:DNA-directed RNA polymerase subunit M/transcription elongation factor TFIIS
MPIQFPCPSCGHKLKAPEDQVGKFAKCPFCQQQFSVPEPVSETEEIYSAEAVSEPGTYATSPAPPADEGQRQPCPMCGEMIMVDAVKCRFCGEIFDETLKKAEKRKKGGGHDRDSDLTVGEIVAAVLCSGIACIIGIVWMIQGKPKGLKMTGLSILFIIFWNVIYYGLSQVGKGF